MPAGFGYGQQDKLLSLLPPGTLDPTAPAPITAPLTQASTGGLRNERGEGPADFGDLIQAEKDKRRGGALAGPLSGAFAALGAAIGGKDPDIAADNAMMGASAVRDQMIRDEAIAVQQASLKEEVRARRERVAAIEKQQRFSNLVTSLGVMQNTNAPAKNQIPVVNAILSMVPGMEPYMTDPARLTAERDYLMKNPVITRVLDLGKDITADDQVEFLTLYQKAKDNGGEVPVVLQEGLSRIHNEGSARIQAIAEGKAVAQTGQLIPHEELVRSLSSVAFQTGRAKSLDEARALVESMVPTTAGGFLDRKDFATVSSWVGNPGESMPPPIASLFAGELFGEPRMGVLFHGMKQGVAIQAIESLRKMQDLTDAQVLEQVSRAVAAGERPDIGHMTRFRVIMLDHFGDILNSRKGLAKDLAMSTQEEYDDIMDLVATTDSIGAMMKAVMAGAEELLENPQTEEEYIEFRNQTAGVWSAVLDAQGE